MDPICAWCEKKVYATELQTVQGLKLHTTCFRCYHCKGKLTLNSYAAINNRLYCKTHYKEIFARGGGKYSAFDNQTTRDGDGKTEELSLAFPEQPGNPVAPVSAIPEIVSSENEDKTELKQEVQQNESKKIRKGKIIQSLAQQYLPSSPRNLVSSPKHSVDTSSTGGEIKIRRCVVCGEGEIVVEDGELSRPIMIESKEDIYAHRGCIKCTECQITLTEQLCLIRDGKLYCPIHHHHHHHHHRTTNDSNQPMPSPPNKKLTSILIRANAAGKRPSPDSSNGLNSHVNKELIFLKDDPDLEENRRIFISVDNSDIQKVISRDNPLSNRSQSWDEHSDGETLVIPVPGIASASAKPSLVYSLFSILPCCGGNRDRISSTSASKPSS